ncbi:hypothetical protein H105_07181 [Trichophyton soudanense CBS 452.61]|uniref:Uncharacterized protein n=1 Tax=Trichophyton soudanense CBS 452.61 TaxID=1215331 RepID=A0A022XIP4_TRISD|nr:hypothetical protein H105_07181 [Trichophyton soudanense CBS 452.61]
MLNLLIYTLCMSEWTGGLSSACLLASSFCFLFPASGEELVDIFNTSAVVEVLYCSPCLFVSFFLALLYILRIYGCIYGCKQNSFSPFCLLSVLVLLIIPLSLVRDSLTHQAFVCSVIHISTIPSEKLTPHSLYSTLVII